MRIIIFLVDALILYLVYSVIRTAYEKGKTDKLKKKGGK